MADVERRTLSRSDIALMVEESVDERVAKAETNIKAHIDLKFGQLHLVVMESTKEHITKAIDDHVESAFPDEVHRHKDYHQSKIDSSHTWDKLKSDLIGWAIKGICGYVLFLLATGTLEVLKREVAR